MDNLYESSIEATAHEEAIASLIEETHLPEDVVRRVYEHELVQLKPGARVKDTPERRRKQQLVSRPPSRRRRRHERDSLARSSDEDGLARTHAFPGANRC